MFCSTVRLLLHHHRAQPAGRGSGTRYQHQPAAEIDSGTGPPPDHRVERLRGGQGVLWADLVIEAILAQRENSNSGQPRARRRHVVATSFASCSR